MHPQLRAIGDEFRDAQAHLHRIAATVAEELWRVRPTTGGWSVGDCVEHLNKTAEMFVPALRTALEEGRALGGTAPARYRRDPMGWLLWRIMPPPVRMMRVRTTAEFQPAGTASRAELVARFDALQQEQLALVDAADGLPLQQIWIRSPFDARVRYNAFSALSILPRHQERHLWQAEQVARAAALAPV